MIWALAALIGLALAGTKKAVQVVEDKKALTTRAQFIADFLAAAKVVDWGGIPPRFALAQADVETGGGSGNVYRQTKNLFSLSVGSGWKGHWNGKTYAAKSGMLFRAYDTLSDSMKDWVQLMHFPIYSRALAAALTNNLTDFAKALKAAGYDASEPRYAEIIVERYNSIEAV